MRSLKIRFSHLKLSGWVPGLSSTLRLMLGLMLGLILTQPAQAIAVKSNPEAAHGCTPPVTMAKAAAAIERFHLREISATPEETRTLGTALLWIEKLNGGKPLEDAVADAVTGYTYHFVQGVGHSQQLGHGIIIRRNGEKNYGQNVAQLVHELGHFLGNNGAYADYRKATKGQFCNVSTYSLANPNEPKLLRRSSLTPSS